MLKDHGQVSDWPALTRLHVEDDPVFHRLTDAFQRTENLPTAKTQALNSRCSIR